MTGAAHHYPECSELTAEQFTQMLANAMAEWHERVTADVPSTTKLTPSVLVGAFPLIFHHLMREVIGAMYPASQRRTTLGNAHGRERALMTDHQPSDVAHEIQIFRDVVIRCAERNGISLIAEQRLAIRCISDEIVRDSLQGYSAVYKQAQEQFNSAVSRDLKNLLNVVSVTGQMVLQKAKDPSISSMATRIIDKVAEADGLLQSAVNPSSIKRNLKLRLSVGQVDLLMLIGSIAVEFDSASRRIKIVGESITGYWSWSGMDSAVRGLLHYSEQFGSGAKEIVVAVRVEYDRLVLSVHNDSSFMPPDELSKAFEADYNYSAHLLDADGLRRVQQIAEGHGGSLIVDVSPESGTTLTLNIPLDARPYVES